MLQIHRQADLRFGEPAPPAEQDARPVVADGARHRRHHRLGYLHPYRHSGCRRIFPSPIPSARAGARRHYEFSAHRQHGRSADARSSTGGPVDCDFVLAGRGCVQFCRIVLRRTGVDDSDCGQRIHLLVRDARRNFRLDHRLGPDPRIRRQQCCRGGRFCRLHKSTTGGLRSQLAGQVGQPCLGVGAVDGRLL